MSPDLRTLLHETAPQPRQPVDIDELFGRVDRRRIGRRTARAAAVLAVLAAVLGVSQLVGFQQPVPLIGEADDVQPTPMVDEAETARDACRGGDDRHLVEGIDLDGDGVGDTVRLQPDGDAEEVAEYGLDIVGDRLTICLGNGQTRDVEAWARRGWDEVEAVSLGGQPGIALVSTPSDARDDGREVVFVRWVDGEFGAVGAATPGHTVNADRYEETTATLYGCRPSAAADFEVAVLHVIRNDNPLDFATPPASVHLENQAYLGQSPARQVEDRSPYVVPGTNRIDLTQFPDLASELDPKQLLRELGFTPRCLPKD